MHRRVLFLSAEIVYTEGMVKHGQSGGNHPASGSKLIQQMNQYYVLRARSVTATDVNQSVLDIARNKLFEGTVALYGN